MAATHRAQNCSMYTVYGDIYSGNCYKVRLALHQLGAPCRWVAMDLLAGATRDADYLAKNPNGKIPLLEFADGTRLAESHAILWYLAEGSRLLPQTRLARARALQWMCFEQYSHEPCLAVARFMVRYLHQGDSHADKLRKLQQGGYRALGVMEQHLAQHDFFAGDYSIADIALYAYTHVAAEGRMSLAEYPAVRAWLARVAQQPGHRSMDDFAAGD